MNVGKHIESLLHEHECVIVPDFGGFLVKSSSARFEEQNKQFLPPVALSNFHVHLRKNDGLLIQSIMEAEDIGYDEAAKIVLDFSNQSKKQLKDTKSTMIQGVGKIYLDSEDKIQFRSNKGINFDSYSFGLPNLDAEKINRVEATEKIVKTEFKKRRISPFAASFTVAASLLVLVMASALFFLHNGNSEQQQFVKANLAGVILPVSEWTKDINTLKSKAENSFPKRKNKEIVEIAPLNDKPLEEFIPTEGIDVFSTSLTNEADYHIIIGMFNSDENAQLRYREALSIGYRNTIVKKGVKYYRVMVPFTYDTATRTEAVEELRSNIEPEAWIWETLYQNR